MGILLLLLLLIIILFVLDVTLQLASKNNKRYDKLFLAADFLSTIILVLLVVFGDWNLNTVFTIPVSILFAITYLFPLRGFALAILFSIPTLVLYFSVFYFLRRLVQKLFKR